MSGKPIYLDNDDEPEYYVGRKDADTRADVPVSGLTDLFSYLSLTDGGAVIHASLNTAMVERAEAAGYYFGIYHGDDLRAHLEDVRGVYEVFGDGENIHTSTYRRVFAKRRAQ